MTKLIAGHPRLAAFGPLALFVAAFAVLQLRPWTTPRAAEPVPAGESADLGPVGDFAFVTPDDVRVRRRTSWAKCGSSLLLHLLHGELPADFGVSRPTAKGVGRRIGRAARQPHGRSDQRHAAEARPIREDLSGSRGAVEYSCAGVKPTFTRSSASG